MRTEIGKINSISFGHGGYQDAMIGVTFDLGGKAWGVGDFWGTWSMKRSESCQWTEADRIKILGETVMKLNKLLEEAKVSDLKDLKDVPVEVSFENNTLKSWRILTEVI
jgi:hypothetical protein